MNRSTAVHAHAVHSPRAASHRIVSRRRRVLVRTTVSERERVITAFRTLANGVDAANANARTIEFYRSSGMNWARCLG